MLLKHLNETYDLGSFGHPKYYFLTDGQENIYNFTLKKFAYLDLSGLQIRARIGNLFLYFSTKTYVVGTQENSHNETDLFEHPKHMFKLMGKK